MPYTALGSEFDVSSQQAGSQKTPAIVRLADGRMLVVWGGPTTSQEIQNTIRAQFYDAHGVPISNEKILTDVTSTHQLDPDLAALPNGGFALAWTQRVGASDSIVKVQFFNSAGTETSVEYTIASQQAGNPSLATLPSGSVLLVWTNGDANGAPGDGSGAGIGGTILAPDGTRQDFSVHTTTTGSQTDPSITLLAGGNFVVTWTDQSGVGGDASAGGVKGQIFTPAGVKVGGEFLVNTLTTNAQSDSEVTALPSGGFVAVWTDASGTDGSGTGIRGQVFDANGNKVGAEFQVNSTFHHHQDQPTVTVSDDGGFFVVWTDRSGGTFDPKIKAQQYDAAGNKIGSEILVNEQAIGGNGDNTPQNDPAVARMANGDLFTVWAETSETDGIEGRIFTAAINGTPDADTFTGTPEEDHFRSGGGNDTLLLQQGGNDAAEPGEGDDLVYFGAAYASGDVIYGGLGTDTLVLQGNYSNLQLTALGFEDMEAIVLWTFTNGTYGGADGTPNIYSITSIDANVAAGGSLTVDASQLVSSERLAFNGSAETNGTFFLYGGAGADGLTGGAGGDTIDGGGGADTMTGLAGNDNYYVDDGGDLVEEAAIGGGFDTVYSRANYTLRTGVAVEVLAANGLADGAAIALTGNEFGQSVIGGSGNDSLAGAGGDDTLQGNAGNDSLDGGTGIDIMNGGAGNDIYFVDHGGDQVQDAAGEGGFDAIYSRVNFVLRAGAEIEQIAATGLAPGQGITLGGNEFSQSLISGSGNDDLIGGGGADFLTANDGNDRLDGGTGVDVLTGGAGDDVYFVDDFSDVVVELAGEGSDAVYASSTYLLSGGARVELLATTGIGAGQAITLYGNDFVQTIIGASGDDTLYGLGGNDSIEGNEGADRLDGGAGVDVLRGGAGTDVFQFTAASDSSGEGDNVLDFVSGTDKIDLSPIDADTNVEGNAAFTFIGTGAFTGVAGQLRVESSGGLVHVLGDVNGDGVADLIIHLYNTGGVLPNAGDFVL